MENRIAQGHNKQACQLALVTIPLMLSAKQGSCVFLLWLFKLFSILNFYELLISFHFKIFNTMFNDTRQTTSDRAFSGDVIVNSDGGNATERAIAFLIPADAFKIARNSDPDFNSQVSVLLYKNTFFFPSSFNVSQVS